jgi:hypothetical protein
LAQWDVFLANNEWGKQVALSHGSFVFAVQPSPVKGFLKKMTGKLKLPGNAAAATVDLVSDDDDAEGELPKSPKITLGEGDSDEGEPPKKNVAGKATGGELAAVKEEESSSCSGSGSSDSDSDDSSSGSSDSSSDDSGSESDSAAKPKSAASCKMEDYTAAAASTMSQRIQGYVKMHKGPIVAEPVRVDVTVAAGGETSRCVRRVDDGDTVSNTGSRETVSNPLYSDSSANDSSDCEDGNFIMGYDPDNWSYPVAAAPCSGAETGESATTTGVKKEGERPKKRKRSPSCKKKVRGILEFIASEILFSSVVWKCMHCNLPVLLGGSLAIYMWVYLSHIH